MDTTQTIAPPPPGFVLDAVPPPPPGFELDTPRPAPVPDPSVSPPQPDTSKLQAHFEAMRPGNAPSTPTAALPSEEPRSLSQLTDADFRQRDESMRMVESLRARGTSEIYIRGAVNAEKKLMLNSGIPAEKVDFYFGHGSATSTSPTVAPTAAPAAAPARRNTQVGVLAAGLPPEPQAPTPPPKYVSDLDHEHMARNFFDYVSAGWDASVTGLATRGKLPDKYIPEDAPDWGRVASLAATLAGDLPAMIVGGAGGAAAGTVLAPGAGTAIGGGAGAMAVPAAIRQALVERYALGDIKGARDLTERAGRILYEGSKGAVLGGAMAGGGVVAGRVLGRNLSPTVKRLVETWGALSSASAAADLIEGQLPAPGDFIRIGMAVAYVGNAFGLAKVAVTGLRRIYAKTGIRPEQVAKDIEKNPSIAKDLLNPKQEIPKAYESKIEDDVPPSY